MEWNYAIEAFLASPQLLRSACVLLLLAVVFGVLLGRCVLWLLSIVPFLLSALFRGIYFVLEWVVDRLHRKYGGGFYDVANSLSKTAEKIDSLLLRWYSAWHHAQRVRFRWVVLLYAAAVLYIGVAPMAAGSPESPLAKGEQAYLRCEAAAAGFLESHGLYEPPEKAAQGFLFMQADNGRILKEGRPVRLSSLLRVEDSKPYIPLRSTVESALGGIVGWDADAGQVVVQLGQTEARLSAASETVVVNGSERLLMNSPMDVEGKMYVEAQEFLALLGYPTYWYAESGILAVSDAADRRVGALTLQWAQEMLERV